MAKNMRESLQSPDVTAFCAMLASVMSQSELKLLCQKLRAQHEATQHVLPAGSPTNYDSLLCVQQIVDGYKSWTGDSLY